MVTITGEEEEYFLGAAEPRKRGAKGMCAAVQEAGLSVVGENNVKRMFSHMSSLVTDGASANTGEKGGLFGPSSIACVVVHRRTTVTNVSVL